ncbi:MAG: DUF983 domain-containing protein, partial [Planctomycetota bacterium]
MSNHPDNLPAPLTLTRLLGRCLRVRCPRCGKSSMFSGYFRMKSQCDACGARFERGPGYYLGSIYFNYGLTATLVTAGYMLMFVTTDWSEPLKLGLLGSFTLLFPLWF